MSFQFFVPSNLKQDLCHGQYDFVLDKRILHVAKCTKVQYLLDFLRLELNQPNIFLSLYNKTLFTDSFLFHYPIMNNDVLVIHCTGLLGGAPKDSWKCESCKIMFSSQKQLDEHNSDTHPEKVAFLESNLMANYMKDQSGKEKEFQKNKLKCDSPNCDFTANDQRVLANHRRSHAKKGFSCNICGMQLKNNQSLSRHSSTHTLKDEQSYHGARELIGQLRHKKCFDQFSKKAYSNQQHSEEGVKGRAEFMYAHYASTNS